MGFNRSKQMPSIFLSGDALVEVISIDNNDTEIRRIMGKQISHEEVEVHNILDAGFVKADITDIIHLTHSFAKGWVGTEFGKDFVGNEYLINLPDKPNHGKMTLILEMLLDNTGLNPKLNFEYYIESDAESECIYEPKSDEIENANKLISAVVEKVKAISSKAGVRNLEIDTKLSKA